jgi:hypothetical protein
MATFAIFYKPADVDAIAAWATNPNLAQGLRTYANRLWNAGLKDWSVAPQAAQTTAEACVSVPGSTVPGTGDPDVVWTRQPDGSWLVCDPTIKRIVISGNQVSKQQTVDWLRQVAASDPAALYMAALADDVALTAKEPYP